MKRYSSKWPVAWDKMRHRCTYSAVAKEKYVTYWSRKKHWRREVFDKISVVHVKLHEREAMKCSLLKGVRCYNRCTIVKVSEVELCYWTPDILACFSNMLTQNARGKKCGTFKVARNLRTGKSKAEKISCALSFLHTLCERRVFFWRVSF